MKKSNQTQNEINRLLTYLVNAGENHFNKNSLKNIFPKEFELFLACGFFSEIRGDNFIICPVCDDGHMVEVFKDHGIFSVSCEMLGQVEFIDPNELIAYKFHKDGFIEKLAYMLDLDTNIQACHSTLPFKIYSLGETKSNSLSHTVYCAFTDDYLQARLAFDELPSGNNIVLWFGKTPISSGSLAEVISLAMALEVDGTSIKFNKNVFKAIKVKEDIKVETFKLGSHYQLAKRGDEHFLSLNYDKSLGDFVIRDLSIPKRAYNLIKYFIDNSDETGFTPKQLEDLGVVTIAHSVPDIIREVLNPIAKKYRHPQILVKTKSASKQNKNKWVLNSLFAVPS